MGRLLLRGDLLEGQSDGFCHVIYGRSCGIANCGSRRLDHGNSSTVMRICRISSRSFRRSAGASGVLEPASPVAVTLASGCSSECYNTDPIGFSHH
jgi:hypothetical protein